MTDDDIERGIATARTLRAANQQLRDKLARVQDWLCFHGSSPGGIAAEIGDTLRQAVPANGPAVVYDAAVLAERAYPRLAATGLCSQHRDDGEYGCSVCYPDLRALIESHVTTIRACQADNAKLRDDNENQAREIDRLRNERR